MQFWLPDGGVAARIAATGPAAFAYSDAVDAEAFGQMAGRCQFMTATAVNHHIVVGLGIRMAPSATPVAVPISAFQARSMIA